MPKILKKIFNYHSTFIFLLVLITLNSCSEKVYVDYSKFTISDYKNYQNLISKNKNSNYQELTQDEFNNAKINLAKKYYLDGLNEQSQGMYAESIIDFNAAYELDSNFFILHSIAQSLKELKRYDMALKYLSKVYEIKPNHIPSLELTSDILFFQYDYKNGLEIQEKILKLNPSKEKKLELARYYEFYDINRSIELYEEVLDSNEYIMYAKSLTKLYEEAKDTNKLVNILNIQYNQAKNNKIAQRIFNIHLNQNDYRSATNLISRLEEHLEYNNLKSYYHILLNEMLRNSELLYKDKDYYIKFISGIENQFNTECDLNLLKFLIEYEYNQLYYSEKVGNQKKKANELDILNKLSINTEKFLDRILKNCYTNTDIISRFCLFLFSNGEYDFLYKTLNKVEPIFKNDFRIDYFYSLYHYEKNDLENSKNHLLLAINKSENNVILLTQLGLIYDRLENVDSSDYYYLKVLSIDSSYSLANNNYAYSLSKRNKNLDIAEKLSLKSLESDPNNPSYLDTYGWILYQRGNYQSALEYILKSISQGESTAEVYEHAGEIYLKLNDTKNAIIYFNKSIELDSNERVLDKIKSLSGK